jgi:hypothetical protein
LVDEIVERTAGHQFHDDVGPVPVLVGSQHKDTSGMGDLAGQAALLAKALNRISRRGKLRTDQLESDTAAGRDLGGFEDRAHAAGSEPSQQAVIAYTGTRFLGTFAVPKAHRVGVLSAESGEATLQETARRICAARQMRLSDCAVYWCFTAPSLDRAKDRKRLADFLRQERIDVLFIDPLYLCLLSGGERVEAANIYEMGPLLRRIGQTCLDAGTTPVLVHHTRKSTPIGAMLPELDDLAYAEIAEYARQWLLVGRTLPYEPGSGDHALVMAAGGSAGHAGCWALHVREGNLRTDFSGRRWDVKVAPYPPALGKGSTTDRRQEADDL